MYMVVQNNDCVSPSIVNHWNNCANNTTSVVKDEGGGDFHC